jgi:hypothetical protein
MAIPSADPVVINFLGGATLPVIVIQCKTAAQQQLFESDARHFYHH